MRQFLCIAVVVLFANTANAQFGKTGSTLRNTTKTNETTARKTTEKGRTDRVAKGEDKAAADTEMANALLAIMDTDGDGVVSKAEYAKAMAALHKIKKDPKTGNITYEKPADKADAVAGGEAAQNGVGPGAGNGRGNSNNEMMARFMAYDTNHDGVLSPNEVPPQARAMLRDADLNKDGVIDAAELQMFAKRMGDRAKAFGAGVNSNGVPGDGRPRNDK